MSENHPVPAIRPNLKDKASTSSAITLSENQTDNVFGRERPQPGKNYESEGRTFESFRARQFFQELRQIYWSYRLFPGLTCNHGAPTTQEASAPLSSDLQPSEEVLSHIICPNSGTMSQSGETDKASTHGSPVGLFRAASETTLSYA